MELGGKGERHENGLDLDLTFTVVPGGFPMITKYLKRLIIINKEAILMEILAIKGLMQLLMKSRNTDKKWTRAEKKEIKMHLRNIAKIVPTVVIFFLPGGSFLLPILVEAIDRRKTRRLREKKIRGGGIEKVGPAR